MCPVRTNGVTITYVYDALGKLAEEFTSGSFPTRPCTTCYLSSDHLGSTRMVTDQNGALVSLHDYLPFGEEIISGDAGRPSVNGAQDNTDQKFTGQLRDSESNLDYFNARYFAAALGRFTSPDPANAGADPTNPQSWNAYAYVLGNPLATTDPTGLDPMTNPVPVSCPGCTTTVYGGTPDPIDLVFYQSLTGDLGSSQGLFSITHTEQQAPPPPLKMPKQPPKSGTQRPGPQLCAGYGTVCFSTTVPTFQPVNWKKFTMYLSCLAGTRPELMAAASGSPEDVTDSTPETQGPTTVWGYTPGKQKNGGQRPLNSSSAPEVGEAAANAPSYLNNALACSAVVANMK